MGQRIDIQLKKGTHSLNSYTEAEFKIAVGATTTPDTIAMTLSANGVYTPLAFQADGYSTFNAATFSGDANFSSNIYIDGSINSDELYLGDLSGDYDSTNLQILSTAGMFYFQNGNVDFGGGDVSDIFSLNCGTINTGQIFATIVNASLSVFVANVSAAPATPTGGGVLYVQSGALKYKGSSGTVTTLGAA